MFTAQFIIASKTERPQWLLKDEKMCYIQIMEYNPASARKETSIMTHATTWRNSENIILRKIRQSHKDKYYINPLPSGIYRSPSYRYMK